MFERRLKSLFVLLIVVAAVVLLRAAHVQIINADHWREEAARNMQRTQLLPTVRGDILDRNGRKLATDEPCIDAAVDYRAIVRDPDWMRERLRERLRANPGYRNADKAGRARLSAEESARLGADIDGMWRTLAQVAVPPRTPDEMELIKTSVRRHVDTRRRYLWYTRYRQAMQSHEDRGPAPWYREWLLSNEPAPEIESFRIEVAEEFEAHVILPNVSPEVHNFLKKQIERLPGLVLRPSKHRTYPYGPTACHILGYMAIVAREDMQDDPNIDDELRKYDFTDMIGRGGIERLCDQALRGVRGRIVRELGRESVLDYVEPVRGRDVQLTIDAELQAQIEHAFKQVEYRHKTGQIERHPMHGAAVVLDVASGNLLALASYPTFDVGRFDELYKTLVTDYINRPLLNRATQFALEPGSTIKPVVGLAAIAEGVISIGGTVECTGYLVINGKQEKNGRCWTAQFLSLVGLEGIRHHRGGADPHPTGHLTFSDALQRSCNVFFEVLGDKLGLERLGKWYHRFGLGERADIGIPETAGLVPGTYELPAGQQTSAAWFSAIGQSQVRATPLQMANVAATIARDGVWMRPRLLIDGNDANATTKPAGRPDRVDLELPPAALAAAREGMIRVVSTVAGTGHALRHDKVSLAGKTGTAQAQRLQLARVGPDGKVLLGADGRPLYETPSISTPEDPNAQMPWYRGTERHELSHAWFIGFAPARNPKIAFAVMLEYGGSGGHDTAPIVRAMLDACIEHGYLPAEH